MNQRLFLALFFLLILLLGVLILAFLTIPAKRTITEVKEVVPRDNSILDLEKQFAPLTIITKLPAGTRTRTDVFDASGNRIY